MSPGPGSRDRALRRARALTVGGVAGALGLGGAFSTVAAMTFSGKPAATQQPAPKDVPAAAAPVQHPPPPPAVVRRVVHRASAVGAYYYPGGPAPPRQAPGAAPPPPPPPACVSTPTHPC